MFGFSIYTLSPHLRDVHSQDGYNYAGTQSTLTDFTSNTNDFTLTFAHGFNH